MKYCIILSLACFLGNFSQQLFGQKIGFQQSIQVRCDVHASDNFIISDTNFVVTAKVSPQSSIQEPDLVFININKKGIILDTILYHINTTKYNSVGYNGSENIFHKNGDTMVFMMYINGDPSLPLIYFNKNNGHILNVDTTLLPNSVSLTSAQANSQSLLLAGATTTSVGNAYLGKYTKNLIPVWDTIISLPNYHVGTTSAAFLTNNNYVFCLTRSATMTSNISGLLYWTDSLGNELQQKVFPLGAPEDYGISPKVYAAADGGMWFWFSKDTALFAPSGGAPNNKPNYIAKMDAWGKVKWSYFYPTKAYPYDQEVMSFAETPDGGLVLVGRQISNITLTARGWITRVDSSGNKLWEKGYSFSDSTGSWDWRMVKIDTDGSIVTYGTQLHSPETQDCGPMVVFARYLPDGTLATELPAGMREIQLWPNPATDRVQLTLPEGPAVLRLMCMTGQLLLEQQVSGPEATLWLQNQAPGMYLVQVITADGAQITRRVVVE